MEFRIGCSGWSYDFWKGKVYNFQESQNNFLKIYSKLFDTVEIDSTFYAAQGAETVKKWYDSVPKNFIFSPKMPKKITHDDRLQNCKTDLNFFLKNTLLLKEKLGIILIQLPPDFVYNLAILEDFIEMLPQDIEFAIEFRHTSWFRNEIYSLLANYGITMAWPVLDYIKPPFIKTTENLYVRFLGNKDLKKDQLGEIRINRHEEIRNRVSDIIKSGYGIKTAFIYANNHYEGFSPETLKYIRKELGLPDHVMMLADKQKRLF